MSEHDKAYAGMMAQLESLKAQVSEAAPVAEKATLVAEKATLVPEKVVAEAGPIAAPVAEYPDAEKIARSQGWRPKEEFKGNPDDWVDAETFAERGFFRNVESLKKTVASEAKKNAELRDMVGALLSDIKDAEAKAREKVLKEIEAKKREAELANDLHSYKELAAKEAEYLQPKPQAAAAPSGPSPAYKEVVARHTWIEHIDTDEVAAEKFYFCNREIDKLLKVNPKASEAEQFAVIDRVIAERYPDADVEVAKPKVGSLSGLSGGKPKEASSSKINVSNLTASQKLIYESLAKDPKGYSMTPDEYLKSLNKRGS